MSIIRKLILTAMSLMSLSAVSETYISETHYDWSGLANSITSASKPDYEKARDIYDWMTRNISYDTTYSIHTADETYQQKRGVCQGYCEMFYRIGEAVGLKSDIIFGKSKNREGKIGDIGHAWLFVYTDGNSGILVDPTWGAGSVNDGRFVHTPNDTWFHASPQWMIYTHYPDNPQYQLLTQQVSFDTFRTLPHFTPAMANYGYNAKETLSAVLSGNLPEVPQFYDSTISEHASAIKMPAEKMLRVGSEYEFYIMPKSNGKFVIINGNHFERGWTRNGKQTAIRYMPHTEGPLSVCVDTGDKQLSTLVEFEVAHPTPDDIGRLESKYPLFSPHITKLAGYDRNVLENSVLDPHRLLEAVKAQGITELPEISPEVECRLVSVPWNGHLRKGQTYTFAFTPGKGKNFAVINGDNWTTDWSQDSTTGVVSITATPTEAGTLKVSASIDEPDSFWQILEYKVD